MMTVRPATIEDADATARVQVESWLETYRGIVPESYLQSLVDNLPQRQQCQREKIAANDTIQLVGCNGKGEVVGWLAAGNTRAERPRSMGYTGEIYAIYLVKSACGQGLGRAMMREAFDRLSGNGHQRIYVVALRDNVGAVRFYERLSAKLLYEDTLDLAGQPYAELVLGFDF